MSAIEYELTDEQLRTLTAASRPVPAMFGPGGTSLFTTPQENANRAWAALGTELGFNPMTVRPVQDKGPRFFTAVPA